MNILDLDKFKQEKDKVVEEDLKTKIDYIANELVNDIKDSNLDPKDKFLMMRAINLLTPELRATLIKKLKED